MTLDKLKLYVPHYDSVLALVKDLGEFESALLFSNAAGKEAAELSVAIIKARLTLKTYLMQLKDMPGGKRLSPDDVAAAFNRLTLAWQKAAAEDADIGRFAVAHYEDAIATLLKNPDAVKAAIKEVHLSKGELVEEAIK